MTKTATNQEANSKTSAPEFAIGHIYVKDLSFELITPMHQLGSWEPNAEISRKFTHTAKENNEYEVVLTISIKVSSADKKAFIIEVQQAGAFLIKNFTEQQVEHLLESYCLSVLLPYARSAVSSQITQGGFPPLFLPPVDFESEYQHKINQSNAS